MHKLWCGFIVLVLTAAAAAQTLESKVDAIVTDAMKQGPVAGASVFVRQHGRVLLAKGYGKASIELDVPMTRESVLHFDSITKHFTAAAILHLVAQGKLSLDDHVTKYLDGAPAGWKDITLRELLSHTSGVPNFTDLPEWTDDAERVDHTEKQMFALISKNPLDFAPGTNWKYSNSGFYLLGMVIEKVTGKPYADYMRDEFFTPLRLKVTYCSDEPLIPNRAAGYEVDKGVIENATPISWAAPFSAGALCGRAIDIADFEAALVAGKLFPPALLDEMRAATTFSGGHGPADYGFGTRRGMIGMHRAIGHTGSGGGFNNAFEYFPDDDLTVVVLKNTEGVKPSTLAIAGRIARAALEVEPETAKDLPVPAESRAVFTGTFRPGEGDVETSAAGDRMRFRLQGGPPDWKPMSYQGGGWFLVDADTLIHFSPAGDVNVYVGGLITNYGRKVR